jgi:hypothetical protein
MAKAKKSGKKSASKGKSKLSKNLAKMEKSSNFIVTNNVKSNISGYLISIIIFTLIYIIAVGYIIKYLNDLKKCDCFEKENASNKVNLNYIIIIEYVSLVLGIIALFKFMMMYYLLSSIKSGGGDNSGEKMFMYVYILLTIGIYGFFIYNVFELMKNTDSKCECTQKPIRFVLYFQTILMSLSVLSLVVALFTI